MGPVFGSLFPHLLPHGGLIGQVFPWKQQKLTLADVSEREFIERIQRGAHIVTGKTGELCEVYSQAIDTMAWTTLCCSRHLMLP